MNETVKTVLKWTVIILVPCGLIALVVYKILPGVWNKLKSTFTKVTGIGKDEAEENREKENMAYAIRHVNDNGGVGFGFNALTAAATLRNAMEGIGTDEETVINTFRYMTAARVLATYIAFGSPGGDNLETWIENDFSGKQRTMVQGYLTNAGIKV